MTRNPPPAAHAPRDQALRCRDVLVLPHAEGQMVFCVEGTVSITHEPMADAAGTATRMRVRALSDAKLHLVPLPAH